MRIGLWKRALPAATLRLAAVLAATVGCAATPALAAFDTELIVQPTSSKTLKVEKPAGAQDYIDHVSIYIRFLPGKGGPGRMYPVFINTHNYLVCPDDPDKHILLDDVKEVSADRRSGVRVLGLFFKKPPCDTAKQYFEAISAD